MDKATVGGLVLAWVALMGSALMEGAPLGTFLNLPAFILIVGGTLGVTMMSYPLEVTLGIGRVTKNAIFSKHLDLSGTIKLIVSLAEKARREGLLALESSVEKIEDAFLKKGVQLVADGFDMQITRSIMETELTFIEERHKQGEGFYSTMGGFSPTLGIIGTVLGLVNALRELEDPSKMGAAIAGAFIATFYGVSFANLIFLPLGNKLKARNEEEALVRNAMIEGILSIEAGDNPRITEEKLKVFLPPKERVSAIAEKGATAKSEAAGAT
jgi:chemotaxis protein MotA